MKTIGYIRYSSEDQGDGDSIGRQTANIESYCQRNGLTLVDALIDKGLSASKGHHISKGKLGRFLDEADSGKFRGYALVVEELDRLSRLGISLTDAIIERILAAGLVIHITQENRVIKSQDDLMTVIFNAVKNYGAKEYTDKLSERTTKGKAERREKILNGEEVPESLPAWLEGKNGKVCKVLSASGKGKSRKIPASVVVAIFELASQGYGAPRILRSLNGRGARFLLKYGSTRPWAIGLYLASGLQRVKRT